MTPHFRRNAMGIAILSCVSSFSSHAQDSAAPPAAAPTLNTVTISASGLELGGDDMTTPTTVLEGDALVLQRGANLGETLERENGVRATHFGAGASRPVIRGLDGPRVKLLSDGAEIQDASTISPDHAVASEPLLARQIEVLRGPSALAYGGGAVGGVVNILDNKIPTRLPINGFEGSVELQGRSREGAGAFELTKGVGSNLVLHLEGARREADDYRVGAGWSGGRRVDGSYSDSDSLSAGLSWIGSRGYLGVAYTRMNSRYGLPGHNHSFEGCHPHGSHLHCPAQDAHGHGHDDHDAHEEEGHDDAAAGHGGHAAHGEEAGHAGSHGVPWVDLRSERLDLRGEYRDPLPGFSRVRLRAAVTNYRHHEIEDGEIATTFRNKSHEGRLELEHHPLAGWRGLIGLQTSQRKFSALGEEAYVAPTKTDKNAVFLLEEKRFGDVRVEAALRHEWQRIDVESTTQPDTRHSGTSVSTGAVWRFTPGYSLGASLSRTQRLPTAEELYADGLHLATSTYEVGNAALKKETSQNVDLTLAKTSGDTTFSVTGFHNRVKNYIYANTLDNFEGLQLIEYAQRDATFTGVEAQIRQKLNPVFGVTLFGDYVRAKLDATGAGNRNLPRIPAQRVGVRLDASYQGWGGLVEVYRMNSQQRVAEYESSTPGYTMVNLGASYKTRINRFDTLFYARADNLTNELAFSHTSFIKNAAPLRGRSFTLGARVTF
ncbi:MAG: TonB-dependent receptor [Variovorax sp.]|nr:MAG: TonB-dependent receptor [Variovorax sp.]